MLIARRSTTRFDGDDVSDSERLLRGLNEFALDVSKRLAALEASARVVVLDDIYFETGVSIAANTAPFPLPVMAPFSVAGVVLIGIEDAGIGEMGLPTAAVGVIGRPLTGGAEGDGAAYEIQFISGLTAGHKYRIRLAAVGVRNG